MHDRLKRKRKRTVTATPWRLVVACLLFGFVAATPLHAEPVASAVEAPPPTVSRAVDSRATYRSLIERAVIGTTLPADVAEAVMGVESGYNPARIGADGEIGLMQVMPPTARMLGFNGTLAELAVPEVNIRLGVNYLAQAWSRAGADLCTALMKYRAGHGETRFSHLSVDYCLKARGRLAAMGYRVTGVVPVATFGSPGMPSMAGILTRGCRGRCIGLGGGRVDFAALNNKLNLVVMQTGVKPAGRQ